MVFSGSAGDSPDLLEPTIKFFFTQFTRYSLSIGRLPITTWFPLHENEFHIVLDDGIRFIRLAEELGPVRDLI